MTPRTALGVLLIPLIACACDPAATVPGPQAPPTAKEEPLDARVFEAVSAATADGRLRFVAHNGWAIHTHGGDAAELTSARFTVVNTGAPARVGVRRVDYLRGTNDDSVEVASTPKVVGLTLGSSDARSITVELPAGEAQVVVEFEAVMAYSTWRDRFGFRVVFVVDGREVEVVAETRVEREEPDRED